MEQFSLTEEDLQEVTGGLDKGEKIAIGVDTGVVGLVGLGVGAAAALLTRKPAAAEHAAGATTQAAAPSRPAPAQTPPIQVSDRTRDWVANHSIQSHMIGRAHSF